MSKEMITIIFLVICILILDICIYKLTNDIKILSDKKKCLENEINIYKQRFSCTYRELVKADKLHIQEFHGIAQTHCPVPIEHLRHKARDELFKQIEPYVEYTEIDKFTLDKSGFERKCIANISVQVKK